jgi:hypothetical protein
MKLQHKAWALVLAIVSLSALAAMLLKFDTISPFC